MLRNVNKIMFQTVLKYAIYSSYAL